MARFVQRREKLTEAIKENVIRELPYTIESNDQLTEYCSAATLTFLDIIFDEKT